MIDRFPSPACAKSSKQIVHGPRFAASGAVELVSLDFCTNSVAAPRDSSSVTGAAASRTRAWYSCIDNLRSSDCLPNNLGFGDLQIHPDAELPQVPSDHAIDERYDAPRGVLQGVGFHIQAVERRFYEVLQEEAGLAKECQRHSDRVEPPGALLNLDPASI